MGIFDFLSKKKQSNRIDKSLDNFNELYDISDINKIWQIENKNNLVVALWGYLSRKSSYGEEIQKLSPTESVVYFCQTFNEEINNGGFSQYFYNSSGDFSLETLKALKTIGSNKNASIFENVLSVFPNFEVPKDRDKREKLLDEIFDDNDIDNNKLSDADNNFYNCGEDITDLSYVYASTNKVDFS